MGAFFGVDEAGLLRTGIGEVPDEFLPDAAAVLEEFPPGTEAGGDVFRTGFGVVPVEFWPAIEAVPVEFWPGTEAGAVEFWPGKIVTPEELPKLVEFLDEFIPMLVALPGPVKFP